MWSTIEQESDLETLLKQTKPFVLFKHSERCSVSRMAKRMFEQEWNSDIQVYLINVIEARPTSNWVAQFFGINHQSPQVLVIRDGRCSYHASHDDIKASTAMLYV